MSIATILGGWHVYLISVSETTIEFYTNKTDARNMRKKGKVRTFFCQGLSYLSEKSFALALSIIMVPTTCTRHAVLFFAGVCEPLLLWLFKQLLDHPTRTCQWKVCFTKLLARQWTIGLMLIFLPQDVVSSHSSPIMAQAPP